MVERSHGSLRSAKDIDSDRLHKSGDKLDHSGMRCRQLDYIDLTDNCCTRSEALPSNRKEATQNDRSPTGDRHITGPATASVRPAVRKPPNVIVVEPIKTADRPVICRLTTSCVEIPEPIIQRPPDMLAEEASTGDRADNQPLSVNQLYTMTTVMNLPTDYVFILFFFILFLFLFFFLITIYEHPSLFI